MSTGFYMRYILTICLVLSISSSACSHQSPVRILFIGNSYTYYNGGIDKQLRGLAPSIETECVAVGGYNLEKHWTDGKALEAIHKGGWDYVVLQEQSQIPVTDQERFYEYAGKFDHEIRNSGAKTIILMTWERPDSIKYGVTTENLASACNALGAELAADVAPAGLAFANALRDRPDLVLYARDGHPTIEGTYLTACVLYAVIFKKSPLGNPYADGDIRAEAKSYFQQIAAKSLGY
jgi:hypothetical protein